MAFINGTRLIVVTNASPDHVASRFVCHHVAAEQYVCLDSSGELIAEDYDDQGLFAVVRILPDDGTLPFGVAGVLEDWDDFDVWPTDAEGRALFAEAARLAKKLKPPAADYQHQQTREQQVRGLEPRKALGRGGSPFDQPFPSPVSHAGGLLASDGGNIVPAPQPGGGLAALSRALQDKVPAFQSSEADPGADSSRVDLRVLPVVYEGTGNRFRMFRDVVSLSSTVTWPDWPILGPSTVQWCLTLMRDKSGSPTAWHSFWRTTGGIDDSSHLCMIH
jgi:hypothetical protein